MITKQTAYDIWCAYDEITKAQKLLKSAEDALKESQPFNLRDSFGRPRSLQLGVPSGESSHRLFDVHPALAEAVIRAHIAEKQERLIALNELAKREVNAPIPKTP